MVSGLPPMKLEGVTEQVVVSSFIEIIRFNPDTGCISSGWIEAMSAIILVYGRVVGIHLYTPSIPYWTSPIVLLFHIDEEIILLIEKAEWFYSMRRLRYNRCVLYVIHAPICI